MSSDLIVSLSASSCLLKVHALQDGILSILGPNSQHGLLQSLVAQLLRRILEHIELQRTQILCHTVAGQTNPTDGIGWIVDGIFQPSFDWLESCCSQDTTSFFDCLCGNISSLRMSVINSNKAFSVSTVID